MITQDGYAAGALAVKELNSNLNEIISKPINRIYGGGSGSLNITVPYSNAIIAISILSDTGSDTLSSTSTGITKLGFIKGSSYSGCFIFAFSGTADSTVTFTFSNTLDDSSWAYVVVEGAASAISSTGTNSSTTIIGNYGFIFGGRDTETFPAIYYNKSTIVIKQAEMGRGVESWHYRQTWVEAIKLLDNSEIIATLTSYDSYSGAGSVGVY